MIVVGKNAAPLDWDQARKLQKIMPRAILLTDEEYLNLVPKTKEVTFVNKTIKNTILFSIGGPVANKFTEKINDKLPQPFRAINGELVLTKLKPDEGAIQVLVVNQTVYDPLRDINYVLDKWVCVLAGNWRQGTERATNELLKMPEIRSNIILIG